MGSEISVVVEAGPATPLSEVPEWFRSWERRLSRFDPASELCALNRSSGAPWQVSPTLWQVLRAALAAADATGGLVTPTILEALESAGYTDSFERVPTSGAAVTPAPKGSNDFRSIELDESRRMVTLPTGLRLDLGGTGKGWAADQAAAQLAPLGPAQVNAGGDISLSGPRDGGRAWEIAVESPLVAGEVLGVLALDRGGVATSGRSHRRWQRGGVWQHHLIDPRSGCPARTDVISATVVGPSALVAEVAAKQVLILGAQAGMAWLEAQASLAGLVVLDDGTVTESSRMGQYWLAPGEGR